MDTVDPRELLAGPSSATTGLTLTIPSLKMLKDKAKQKASPLSFEEAKVKKLPRPLKLKLLKEVLSALITKIKKKDDYAFFLKPVDADLVPGYADVVKRPMDFGTMTTKVVKGRYRSLEEFASDFRLVIDNAKAFNPPGTIHHTEAERIENWASEHISKAAATVIEYETDWNIDVEREEDVNIDAEDDMAGTRAGSPLDRARSQSVFSTSAPPSLRRPRGTAPPPPSTPIAAPPAKKPGMLSESLEADGHLPGYKDGLSAFPPGSHWAELMVALKLKGKRYKTKKERLRIEKGGPPYAPDGSLDYGEMEDPFYRFADLVPEPFARPHLRPIYAPAPVNTPHAVPSPVNVPVPSLLPHPTPSAPAQSDPAKKPRHRHWTITRTGPSRARAKEKEKEKEDEEPPPDPRPPRPLVATDFGPYATLTAGLHAHPETLTTETTLFDAIVRSVVGTDGDAAESDGEYWTAKRAQAAERWVREIVYGGVEGLAYIRSLAEFVSSPACQRYVPALGTSVREYVERSWVDPLTQGRHRLLHAIAAHLSAPNTVPPPTTLDRDFATHLSTSLHLFPALHGALLLLRSMAGTPLDLAGLIEVPQELYDAEEVWAGKAAGESASEAAKTGMALKHATELFARILARREEAADGDVVMKTEVREDEGEGKGKGEGEEGGEDALVKELRLNLVALAKRAPLDQIAKMPADLVPAHLRTVVPTIGF